MNGSSARVGMRQGAPGAGRVEASRSWRGGDCAGGAAIAPIAPAGHAIGGTATVPGAMRAEAGAGLGERKQGAGRT